MKTLKKAARYLVFSLAALIAIFVVLLRFDWFRAEVSIGDRLPAPAGPGRSTADCALSVCAAIKNSRPVGRRERFGFNEKIYAFADVKNVPPGHHRLSFYWINPRQKLQETFRRDFESGSGAYQCWAWIELEGEFFPVSIGPIGSGKFIGEWTVRVCLDGLFLSEATFEVR